MLVELGVVVEGQDYVAGPMTGIAEFNFPAFDSLAAYLRRLGRKAVNPAERDRLMYDTTTEGFAEGDVQKWAESSGFDFPLAMRYDLGVITTSETMVLLPNWEKSTGVAKEKFVAEACGVTVLYAYPLRDGEWYVTTKYHPAIADAL